MSIASNITSRASPEQLATAAHISTRCNDANVIRETFKGIEERGELFSQLQGLIVLAREVRPNSFNPKEYLNHVMRQLDELYYASLDAQGPINNSNPLAPLLPLYKAYVAYIAAQPKKTLVSDPDLQDKATALKNQFPHIRHDADFFDAAMKQLEAAHKTLHGRSWEVCADYVRRQVTHFAENPNKEAGDYKALVELLPAYQKMAAQAEKDYGKGIGRRWFKKPDSYAEMVATERNSKVRDSYAFGF